MTAAPGAATTSSIEQWQLSRKRKYNEKKERAESRDSESSSIYTTMICVYKENRQSASNQQKQIEAYNIYWSSVQKSTFFAAKKKIAEKKNSRKKNYFFFLTRAKEESSLPFSSRPVNPI